MSIGKAEAPKGFGVALGKGITGVQMRYRWAELEPEPDHYDFAAVARDLDAAKSAGVQLVVLIEDKSFTDDVPTPAYLNEKYTVRNHHRGYSTLRWDPYVVERLEQLVAKLGAQFDCNPNFEGVAFQETSPSLDDAALDASGYTPEKYRDALISLLRSALDQRAALEGILVHEFPASQSALCRRYCQGSDRHWSRHGRPRYTPRQPGAAKASLPVLR